MMMSPTDLQLVENGVINLRAICNVFGVDSSLFNDPENKTYANRAEAEKSFYTSCIMPLSNKIAEKYTSFIAWNHYPDKSIRMRQDFSEIECLQNNTFDKDSATMVALKNAGLVTPNEARTALNYEAMNSEGANELTVTVAKTPFK